MNKLVSILVFVAALVWSWNKVHTTQPVNFETHSGIQIRLSELIEQTLKQKFPEASEIKINKLWTEAVSATEIKATFSYEFQQPLSEGESVRQSVSGEAFLKRSNDTTDEWMLEKVTTGANEISFKEGTVVTPLSGDTNPEVGEQNKANTEKPADATPAQGSEAKDSEK